MRLVTLTTERLVLRPPAAGDGPAIAAAISDPDIAHWIEAIPWPYTHTDGNYFVADISGPGWESGQMLTWLLLRPKASTVLGAVGLTQRMTGVFEVGYWLTPNSRGRGLMSEAVRAATDFAFNQLQAQRIEWQAAVGNHLSRAVAERCGIRIEGTARNRLRLEGTPCDSWLGSLLPSDQFTEPVRRLVPIIPIEVPGTIEGMAVAKAKDGSSIVLRPPSDDLVAWVIAVYRDKEISQWNPADVTDEESARRWIRNRCDWSDGSHANWVVTKAHSSRPDDPEEPVGAVSLHKVNAENRSAAIGYWTAPAARGLGIATAAVDMATTWAFGTLGLRRVELIHAVANHPSCSVATANGFALEGVVRDGERYGDGLWYDEHIHGRIDGD